MRAESKQKIDEANALTEVQKYPAFMSVAIYFHTILDRDLVEVMKQLAQDIASQVVRLKGFEFPITIEGFRLLDQYTIYQELNR